MNQSVLALFFRSFAVLLLALPAQSQFKELGPPPFSPATAHQKIRQLLDSVNPSSRKQTVATLSGWTAWYRDILDEELIAAWRRNSRANLPEVIEALGDERVAVGVVAFSWRESRQTTFTLAYAHMLTSIMSRYSKSAEPFLQDLVGQAPALSPGEAEGVCRILIDMPDLGTWRETAAKILPQYPETTKSLLTQDLHAQDLHAGDEDRMYRAEMLMRELKLNSPEAAPPSLASRQQSRHRDLPQSYPSEPAVEAPRRLHVDGPPVPMETEPKQVRAVLPKEPALPTHPVYTGPKSGIYESSGSPIPQSAEFVFRNVPPVQMRLEYDVKIWEARLVPGEGNTQRLIVKNKSNNPQKRCVVRWSVVQ